MCFLRRGVVSTSPNPQAGGPPLVGCPRLLIQFIHSYPSILEAVPPSATWGRAIPWWQGPTFMELLTYKLYFMRGMYDVLRNNRYCYCFFVLSAHVLYITLLDTSWNFTSRRICNCWRINNISCVACTYVYGYHITSVPMPSCNSPLVTVITPEAQAGFHMAVVLLFYIT